jgi:hypothetical protein
MSKGVLRLSGRRHAIVIVIITVAVFAGGVAIFLMPRTHCEYGLLRNFRTNDETTTALSQALRVHAKPTATYANCETIHASDWDASNAYLLLTGFSLADFREAMPTNLETRPVDGVAVDPHFSIEQRLSDRHYYQLSAGTARLPGQINYLVAGRSDHQQSIMITYITSEGVPSL